jgi:hypothetical protein
VARDDDLRKQRFDTATIPHDVHRRDPSIILGAVKQLVAARGEIGDLVIVHTPPGTGQEAGASIAQHLQARTDILPRTPKPPGSV